MIFMNRKITSIASFALLTITNTFCWNFSWAAKRKPQEIKPVLRNYPEAKVIIFDFDGTLVDSLPMHLDSFNRLADKYKYKKVTDTEEFRNKNMQTVVTKELGLSMVQIPLFAKKMFSLYNKKASALTCFKDIKTMIDQLAKKYTVGILTSQDEKVVKKILEKEGIKTINFVYSGRSFFGKHLVLNRLIKRYKYKPQDILYVGDEVRDIEACRKIDLRIASVSWGLNSEKFLKENNPNYLVSKPQELVDLLIPSTSYTQTKV